MPNKHRKPKYIQVPVDQGLVNQETRDAQLGKSAGMRTKLNATTFNEELDILLQDQANTTGTRAGKHGLMGLLK